MRSERELQIGRQRERESKKVLGTVVMKEERKVKWNSNETLKLWVIVHQVRLHAIRKTGSNRWWKETGKKSNTAVRLHFVILQVLLCVNRKFDRSRGRKESRRMNNTAVNPSFVVCQLFHMSFARGFRVQGGRKVRRNSNRDVKLVLLFWFYINLTERSGDQS